MWKLVKSVIPLSIKKAMLTLFQEAIRYINEIPGLYYDLKKIHSLNINNKLKYKIKRTLIRTFYFKKYNRKKMVANIVGYRVKFNYFNILRSLFRDIFISQPYYFHTANKKPFIITCGSHIGMSTLYFKLLYPEAKIICFEPDKYTYQLLLENITSNQLNNVDTHNEAVADYDGEIEFYYQNHTKGNLVMSTIKERIKNGIKTVVKVTKLSRYINNSVDFLKLDIEGAELSVLEELNKNSKLQLIKQMAIEYHHHIIENEDNFSVILKILEEAEFGYQVETFPLKTDSHYEFQDILIHAYNKNLLAQEVGQ